MPHYTEKAEKLTLPVLPLRGVVAFPSIPLSVEVTEEKDVAVCEQANREDGYLFFVCCRDLPEGEIKESDFYRTGTVVKIKQMLKLPEGTVRIMAEGACRASVLDMRVTEGFFEADVMCKTVFLESEGGVREEALINEVLTLVNEFVQYMPKVSPELMSAIHAIHTPGLVADLIACNLLIKYQDKQIILEEFEPLRRLEHLAVVMEQELNILRVEADIHRKVRSQIEDNQREYYLRQQLKVIEGELGEGDADSEIDEYYAKIKEAHLPEEVNDKLVKEVKKLAKTPYGAAESVVIRNYLDVCLEIPWTKLSRERIDLEAARKILERDHNGLEKVKERILEYLAVKKLNPQLKNQIICLVGPPGTGKTSIAHSIATATHRKYVRVSLGGVRDEADIRGHRKTYIGSMPGRIINAIIQAGTRNPLILLDEIDKMTQDAHGDPASALLEVLDSEQNKGFRDHFIELPVDLSDCMFITTANTLETVPRPLIDRMEVIELHSYSRNEKLAIAKDHLLPKQLKRHGLSRRQLRISDETIFDIIDFYTAEAGVRNLERELAALCRKAARVIVENGVKAVAVTSENLAKYLGVRKILPDKIYDSDEIGTVNGLAYTELGGDMLRIEAAVMPGTGKVELTGSLGDVMKESAHAAITYIRSHASEYGIDPDFYRTKDIHIHVPEGAVPKDGPSAGVTMVTALTSELSGIPVKRDVAMTGEITLRGRVLAIGGLKEKTMAAYKAGVRTVLIPWENERDLTEIDPVVRETLHFIPCRRVDEVLHEALVRPEPTLPCADTVSAAAAVPMSDMSSAMTGDQLPASAPLHSGI